jgi:lysylphosphatidylglycerol synthetase-like protein (DUF2156 family)
VPAPYPTKKAAATVPVRRGRDLGFALGIHALALVAYVAFVLVLFYESNWDPFVPNSSWSTLAVSFAGRLMSTGPLVWIIGLLGLIMWWLQRRAELVR